MKSVIALLSVVLSSNAFSYSATDALVITSASPLLTSAVTSGSTPEKQAVILLNDVQEYSLSGRMTNFLSQRVKESQQRHPDQSIADAVDSLITDAEKILARK